MVDSGDSNSFHKEIKHNLPSFHYDNLDYHPFANQIGEELEKSQSRCITIKFNTLLCGFGYIEYDNSVIIEIQRHLRVFNLFVQLPLNDDLKREDHVNIISLGKQGKTTTQTTQNEPQHILHQSAIQNAVNSAVQVISPSDSVGTGFIIDKKGVVVTARHVVEENGHSFRKVIVRQFVQKQNQRDLEAIVFCSHKKLDYALLWLLKDDNYPELKTGDPKKLEYTQTVYAIGCPGGLPITVTKGIIGNPNLIYNQVECIQCDAAIDHGNSGGPLLNENGEVIGITLWGLGDFAGAKFSLPIDYLSDDIRKARYYEKNKSLHSKYCPSCGFADFTKDLWYCDNCGYEFRS
jgi:S1-C subfamily serine protease